MFLFFFSFLLLSFRNIMVIHFDEMKWEGVLSVVSVLIGGYAYTFYDDAMRNSQRLYSSKIIRIFKEVSGIEESSTRKIGIELIIRKKGTINMSTLSDLHFSLNTYATIHLSF